VALTALADTLRAHLREYDLAGRFGGEEFTILLPQTSGAEARRIAERLRERIVRAAIPVSDGSADGFPLRITVSIGVAALDHSSRDLDELVAAADHALYEAKNSGRNAVRMLADIGQGNRSG
jgi:diguanylate cyclase (GGDEF)-like protein